MKHNIPANPNPALTAIGKGPEMRALISGRGQVAKSLYQAVVAKRTGRLARSARVATFIGGRKSDRWVSRLTVGGEDAGYGTAHEFGNERVQKAAHDLRVVLSRLGSS